MLLQIIKRPNNFLVRTDDDAAPLVEEGQGPDVTSVVAGHTVGRCEVHDQPQRLPACRVSLNLSALANTEQAVQQRGTHYLQEIVLPQRRHEAAL